MNKNLLIIVSATAIMAFAVGYLVKPAAPHADEHSQAEPVSPAYKHEDGHHHEEMLQVPAATAPTISIEVEPDPQSGYNVHLATTNFTFSPENASQGHVAGEGHAHLYVNGQKVSRLYSNWYHLAELPEGANTVRITLNTNDHRAYAVGS